MARDDDTLYRARRHLPPARPPRATLRVGLLGRQGLQEAHLRLNQSAYELVGPCDAVRVFYDRAAWDLSLSACAIDDSYAWRLYHQVSCHYLTLTRFWRDIQPEVMWAWRTTRPCRCRRVGDRLSIALCGPTADDDEPWTD